MKKILLFGAALLVVSVSLSGCSTQPAPEATPLPSPTSQEEPELIPVRQVDPTVNASAGAVIDDALKDTSTMLDELSNESFTDLPSDLGQ